MAHHAKLLMHRWVTGDRGATDDVAVAVDVFGGRMNDDVGAMLDGPLQRRREKGVIHDDQCSSGMGGLADCREIGDAQQRVGWGLDPHQRRLSGDRLGRGGWVSEIAAIERRTRPWRPTH